MSLEESIKKLAETMIKQEQNAVDIAAVQTLKDKLAEDITELERKIEESKKPELRHGDYGYASEEPELRLWVDCDDGLQWCNEDIVKGTSCDAHAVALGNIFDDLDALKEDVDGFEIKCGSGDSMIIKFLTYLGKPRIHFTNHCGWKHTFYLTEEHLSTLPMKIKQFAETLKRKAGK